jgi:hypothetical protein
MSYRLRISIFHTVTALALLALLVTAPSSLSAQCGELIVNGDFELGNTGFTTGYTHSPTPPNGLVPATTYAVVANPNTLHSGFLGNDHTSGSGLFMALNGTTVGNTTVWEQTVPVLPGTNYAFSAWVNTIISFDGNRAQLVLEINGVPVGASHFAPFNAFTWTNFARTWNSGAANSATIRIYNLTLAAGGNDFGLDDISFMKIDETAPVLTTASFSVWPPNHEYRTFTLSQFVTSVTDDCDAAPSVVISSIWSDELENAIGLGDGDTYDDIVIAADCQSVQLRAERQGGGNGRVYTIEIKATDASGNSSVSYAKVSVPHNNPGTAVDDGPMAGYTVNGPCSAAPKAGARSIDASGFQLDQNYPNPFNPGTTLTYTLPVSGRVTLRVFDMNGTEVSTLVNEERAAGAHSVYFNAATVPSGLYLYRLESGGVVLQRIMQLVK